MVAVNPALYLKNNFPLAQFSLYINEVKNVALENCYWFPKIL